MTLWAGGCEAGTCGWAIGVSVSATFGGDFISSGSFWGEMSWDSLDAGFCKPKPGFCKPPWLGLGLVMPELGFWTPPEKLLVLGDIWFGLCNPLGLLSSSTLSAGLLVTAFGFEIPRPGVLKPLAEDSVLGGEIGPGCLKPLAGDAVLGEDVALEIPLGGLIPVLGDWARSP